MSIQTIDQLAEEQYQKPGFAHSLNRLFNNRTPAWQEAYAIASDRLKGALGNKTLLRFNKSKSKSDELKLMPTTGARVDPAAMKRLAKEVYNSYNGPLAPWDSRTILLNNSFRPLLYTGSEDFYDPAAAFTASKDTPGYGDLLLSAINNAKYIIDIHPNLKANPGKLQENEKGNLTYTRHWDS